MRLFTVAKTRHDMQLRGLSLSFSSDQVCIPSFVCSNNQADNNDLKRCKLFSAEVFL
jgi:hypothetical protein